MSQQVRDIEQQYWRHAHLPQLELRSTRSSRRAYKAHSHRALSIGAIQSGQTRLECDGRELLLQQGELVIIEPGLVHACNPVGDAARGYHMLYIDTPWCLAQLAALYARPIERLSCEQRLIRQPQLFADYLALVDQLTASVADPAPLFERFAFKILSGYCSPGQDREEQPALCHQVKRLLLENLAQPPSLERQAGQLGYSRETLIRTFGKSFGITPMAFVNNARIEQAKLLLKAGQQIAEVALELGYSDQSQFHRAFVGYTASTPRQYQQARSISDNNR
ncbi:helix-turn-helix transcriptional regulator [Marinobacterium arenosum]|uniref:helix-turn-helix transcriptional regulator n=1 Tax=Marinobacterium arenosum TaxID=2862496 RepID=UPI001C9398E9|nr:AraC family transcriptional regulator [Marinobacterium arenosum]MBY4678193.1 AraC family transcriptional regulator [Marinobacterium arenosum]